MVLLSLLITKSRLGDEPRQDLDGEGLVLLVQGLPGMSFVEEKIEQFWVFFLQVCSPWWPGIYRSHWSLERDGRGEHLPGLVHEASLGESRVLLW